MIYLGDYLAGSTVRGMWNSNAVAGESITRATNGSIRIYKDSSTSERSSAAGITDSEDFDTLTGVHHYAIDLSDNTDAGFYAAGHDYFVVLSGATIDGKAINAVIGSFSIENRSVLTASGIRDAVGLASANLDTQISTIDTVVDAVQAKTDSLPPDPADASDISAAFSTVNSTLSTIAGYIDTEVAAIKAKTDNLPASPAAVGSPMTLDDAAITAAKFAAGAIDANAVASDAATEIATATINYVGTVSQDGIFGYVQGIKSVTDELWDTIENNAGTYRFTSAALSQAPSGSGLDAAGVRDAVGLASADLDTQLAAIVADTNELQADWANNGRLDVILDAIKAKTDLVSEIYHADVDLRIDDANSRDNYRVIWWKDGARITSSITDPTIQVVKADLTDLVAETAMTANVYTFTYQATGSERLTAGQSVEVVVTATINGGTRTFSAVVGRDSE